MNRPKLRTDRLMRLAAHLRTVPPEQFNMRHFGLSRTKPRFECGTVACAAGHATTIPAFRRAGLRMEWERLKYTGCFHYQGTPSLRDREGEAALIEFFGLTVDESRALFYSEVKATAKEKAEQIETLCRTYEEAHA